MAPTNNAVFKKYANARIKFMPAPKEQRQLLWYGASFDSGAEKGLSQKRTLLRRLFNR